MEDVGSASSKTSRDLSKAADEAFKAVQEAHARYHEALADTDRSPDGALAYRQSGRDYASAVGQYTGAVMAWLSHMETNPENAVKLIRKGTSGE